MKIIQIKKRAGGYRTVYVPTLKQKKDLRKIYEDHLLHYPISSAAHGFALGRNVVTNALPHINKKITMSIDLSNFFDTCVKERTGRKFPVVVLDNCFPDGAARQGLPTSPAIANIMAADMDTAIGKMLKKKLPDAVFTRYADDMSISTDCEDYDILRDIQRSLGEIVSRCGFKINIKKSKIRNAKGGRRELCNVMADDDGIHPSKYHRKKLRGLKHKLQFITDNEEIKSIMRKIRGLEEFCKLKVPVPPEEKQKRKQAVKSANAIASNYHLKQLKSSDKIAKVIEERQLADNIYITNDLTYFYGMSTLTTGWTSCMAVTASRSYKRGLAFWAMLPGASLAIMLSDKDKTVAGITKKAMIARCLVFQLRDGQKVYSRLYGHETDKLVNALEDAGYSSCKQVHGLVEGNVPGTYPLPYFDNGRAEKITAKGSGKKIWRVKI